MAAVKPTKAEVKKVLELIMADEGVRLKTIGEFLGMKWVDSLLPKIKGEPEWNYEGIEKFFIEHGIESCNTINEAIEKLKQ